MPGKKGFTLIEVLIASVVLLGAAVVFMDTFTKCSALIESGPSLEIAMNAAQSRMEEIAQSNMAQIIGNYHGKNFPVAGLTAPSGLANPCSVTVTQINGGSGTPLYDVNVTVSWQFRGRNTSRSVRATLARR